MSDWVVVADYGSITEAEVYVEILRAAGIPAVVRSDGAIFGPGFSGSMSRGVRVAVPGDLAESARDLIAGSTDDAPDEPS